MTHPGSFVPSPLIPAGHRWQVGAGFEPAPSWLVFELNAVEVFYDGGTPSTVAAAAGFANWSHLTRSPLPRARVCENSRCDVCSDLPRRKVSVRPGKRATQKGLAFNCVSVSEVRSGGGRSNVGDEGSAAMKVEHVWTHDRPGRFFSIQYFSSHHDASRDLVYVLA